MGDLTVARYMDRKQISARGDFPIAPYKRVWNVRINSRDYIRA